MADQIKRRYDIDYLKILAQRLQQVPAWRDLAGACNEVLGQAVDERRRRLEKIKDSVKYRRGDTLVNVVYEPENGKVAILDGTNTALDIPEGTVFKTAKVKNVIRNIAYFMNSNSKDYLDLSFTYKNKAVRWLKPIDIPQERDALLKNSYIMGFDFFNTKLNDEDLQRLYETIQMYWPESGADDLFMKFIGYIKNTRFDLVPLWSYETEEDSYPILTERPANSISVKDGGNWYLTSHVEIRYDLSQFNEFYSLNLDDLETLFYYFAPIILVLERIVGSLNIDVDINVLTVESQTSNEYGVDSNPLDSTHTIYELGVGSAVFNEYGEQNLNNVEKEYALEDHIAVAATQTSFTLDVNSFAAYTGNSDPDLTVTFGLGTTTSQSSFAYDISDMFYNEFPGKQTEEAPIYTNAANINCSYTYDLVQTI